MRRQYIILIAEHNSSPRISGIIMSDNTKSGLNSGIILRLLCHWYTFPLDKLRIKYETDIRVDRHCLPQPGYAVYLNMLPIQIFISMGRDCTRRYWCHVFLLYRFCRDLLVSELFWGKITFTRVPLFSTLSMLIFPL